MSTKKQDYKEQYWEQKKEERIKKEGDIKIMSATSLSSSTPRRKSEGNGKKK